MEILTETSVKEKFLLLISFFFILFNTFPLFSDLTHIPVQYVCIFTVVSLIVLYPSAVLSVPVRWFAVFISVLVVNAVLGRHIHINGLSNYFLPAAWRIIIEVAWVLPALLIASILEKAENPKLFRYIGYGSVLVITISFLYILPLVTAYSNILRVSMHEDGSGDFAKPLGLPDYTLMHAYVFMLPGLCLLARIKTGKMRIITLVLIALFFYLITQTAVSTSISIALIVIIFSVLYNGNNLPRTILYFFVLGVAALIAYESGLVLTLVDRLLEFFDGTAVALKLEDVRESIIGGELQGETFDVRILHHQESMDSFLDNPIIGGGFAGGHSSVLDQLGTVGLVGFIPFLLTIIMLLKQNYQNMVGSTSKIFFFLVYVIAAVYLYNKGIFGATGWLFMAVIAPSLVIAADQEDPEYV